MRTEGGIIHTEYLEQHMDSSKMFIINWWLLTTMISEDVCVSKELKFPYVIKTDS